MDHRKSKEKTNFQILSIFVADFDQLLGDAGHTPNQLLWLFSAFFVALIHLSAIFHPKTRKKSLKKCFKLLFKAGRWPTPQGGTSILSLLVPFPTIFIESNFLSMSWMKNKYE